MENKHINRGSNLEKNQTLLKNKNNMIKNFHDINNINNQKVDRTVSSFAYSESNEKIKNFNKNKNSNSNNQNVIQNNYNQINEKGKRNVYFNQNTGFDHTEIRGKDSDINSVSGFSERSGSIRYRKINNTNSNLNASKHSSLSKFDKYSIEKLPNLIHRKNNSISADANFQMNKNNEIPKNNINNTSISNISSSKISSVASNYNNITKSPNVNFNINNSNSKNDINLNNKINTSYNYSNYNNNINQKENVKFMKVSNDRLNKEYLKNKFLSDIQRQKIYSNTGNNEPNSNYNSRNINGDLISLPNKNLTLIPNNRNISNILQPKLNKVSRNNSTSYLLNNNNNLSSKNINNANLTNLNSNANANLNNNNLSAMFKKRDLSGNSILFGNEKINDLNNSKSKNVNLNPAKFKVKSDNVISNYNINSNSFINKASKSPSRNNFNIFTQQKNTIKNNDVIINNPNSGNSVSSIGSNVYLKYPENRFAFIENKIKENLINNNNNNNILQPNKANTSHSALNSSEKIKKPHSNSLNNNGGNNGSKILIKDQEKEKEDKLFEFFLQYKNLRKNKKNDNINEIANVNNNNTNNSNINNRYQQNQADEIYLGKLTSLNNSSFNKIHTRQISNEHTDAKGKREFLDTNNSRNNFYNNFSKRNNLSKEKINEYNKNVKFENSELSNYYKINDFNNSNQNAFEKRSNMNKFINSRNDAIKDKDANLPMINKSYRKIDDSSLLNEFNKSIIANQNLNKISNTHQNFFNPNNINYNERTDEYYYNNNLDEKVLANKNIEKLNHDLIIFADKLNKFILNKKFNIFDELITYAYTKDELTPTEKYNGNLLENDNLNEKDFQIIENIYENENQELMRIEGNYNYKDFNKNINNKNSNENYLNNQNNDYNNDNNENDSNYNSNEDAKFNSLKVNILKLNLFAIMRICSKYKRLSFYFFLHKLIIYADSIKIFNTADNFLYFDPKFKLHKLDNAKAYRKLQHAVKLICNRRIVQKYYFRFWQDLVFNFNLNPQNRYNSNKNNKYIFTEYYNLPKSIGILNNNNINSNIDYSNQSLKYQPYLTDENMYSSSQNKNKFTKEIQSDLGIEHNIQSITQENKFVNFNDKNYENNFQAVDKILNTYSATNLSRNSKILGLNNKQRKSQTKFITDKDCENEQQRLNKNILSIKDKFKNLSANNLNSFPNLNIESKPAIVLNYLENNEEPSKDKKEISYLNKLNSLVYSDSNNNNNNNNNINVDSDDMMMSHSDDEGIKNKLVINNFEKVNSEADFSLNKTNLFNSNNNNNALLNLQKEEFDSKNSLRTKIFKNFISLVEQKNSDAVKLRVIKAGFFRLFVLKVFGETPLREIMQKRISAQKEYLMRKYESINILDKIFLRRKNEAKKVLFINLGLQPAIGILNNIQLNQDTINILNNNNSFANAFSQREIGIAEKDKNKELIELFNIYKTFASNFSMQNLQNLADYLKKKLPKNVNRIKFAPEAQDVELIAELVLKNFIDDKKLNVFQGLFTNESAFEYMKIKSLSDLGSFNNNNNDKDNETTIQKISDFTEMYINEKEEDENEKENQKFNQMTTLFLSCDNSEKFRGLLQTSLVSNKIKSINKTLLKHFTKWKYLNDYFRTKDILSRKGNQSLRISFINDKVFYTKKNPKTEIKILRKDLNNIRIYALNTIIKAVNNILNNNKTVIFAKSELLNKILFKVKLKNTLRFYGENYKKINSFMGIENFSNRKKNVYLIRDAYKRFLQLQKVFLLMEKYRFGFSRYLNFVNNQVLVSQINSNNNLSTNNNNVINNNSFLIENNKNSLIGINSPNKNLTQNIKNNSNNNKLYRILNFLTPADSNYFNKKKAEAQNACFANLYVNICFSKWKLYIYRCLTNKVEYQKNLILFIKKIENVFVQKLNNEGKYFLISNLHIDNNRLDFNKENESLNPQNNKNNSNINDEHSKDKQVKTGSVGSTNSKKLILVEEKIRIYTKYNRFVYLTKLEFFENLKRKADFIKLTEYKITKMHNHLIYVACNIFVNKSKLLKIEVFSSLKNFVDKKTKKLQKQEALRSIIQLQRLSNAKELGHFKSLAEFAKRFYTKIIFRKKTLQKYFYKWKDELKIILNKIKIQEKHNYEKYHDELSPGIYDNNKLFAEKLEQIKLSKLKNSTKNKTKKALNYSIGENQITQNDSKQINLTINSDDKANNIEKTNEELNEEFGEKVVNFTNNEFEIFFFKILSESKAIPKSKIMFFLRSKVNELQQKNLNFYFKKFRIKLNLYFKYNKILAALYSNKNLESRGLVKDEAYFLGLHNKKIPSLPEQMGNKIRVTAPIKEAKHIEPIAKIASFSQKLSIQRIDYLINQNQSRIILDYETDETKLDKEINFCKKIINEKSYIKLARIFIADNLKTLSRSFNKWKNVAFYPEKEYYSNILENFENVRNENDILVNTLNKAKSDYKKLIQDYKTLKNYFCENCMNGEEEYNLDMKSIKSDTSNINASDLKADSNYNSENTALNKRKSLSPNSNSPNIGLNNKISEMEKNIKNLQNEFSNKKVEYETIINNFEEKKKVILNSIIDLSLLNQLGAVGSKNEIIRIKKDWNATIKFNKNIFCYLIFRYNFKIYKKYSILRNNFKQIF